MALVRVRVRNQFPDITHTQREIFEAARDRIGGHSPGPRCAALRC